MKKILLNKEIYTAEILQGASEAFSALTDITIADNQSYWICTFENCRYDAEMTAAEFENYAIDLVNTHA